MNVEVIVAVIALAGAVVTALPPLVSSMIHRRTPAGFCPTCGRPYARPTP